MNILDRDHVSAKHYIDYAFLDLLEFQSFKQISVKDIVKKAGISRSTFYLHYHDKFDLLSKARTQITDQFLSHYAMPKHVVHETISDHTVVNLCQHVYEFRNFYQYEFQDPTMLQALSNRLSEKLFQVYDDQAYALFASYGTIGYLSYWVKEGFIISSQEAASKLLAIGFTDWTTHIAKYESNLLVKKQYE